jgi:hypothetical protein
MPALPSWLPITVVFASTPCCSEAGLELAHDIVIDMLSGMLAEEDAQEAGMKLLLAYLVNPEVPGAAR